MRTKIKDLRRRQRRQQKIRKLKARLAQAKDPQERERLIAKIWQISTRPPKDLPEIDRG